jgi:hypothetical protein
MIRPTRPTLAEVTLADLSFIKASHVHGKTDDFGFNVVEDAVHVHDLNATLLHLLGFDHTKLTYVHGHLVKGILA